MTLPKFQHLLTELNGLNLGSLDSATEYDSQEEDDRFLSSQPSE